MAIHTKHSSVLLALVLSGCGATVHTIQETDLASAAPCLKLSEESCVSTFAGPLGQTTGYLNCKDELMSKGEKREASHIVWTSWASNTVTTVTAQTFDCRKSAGIGARLRAEGGRIMVSEVVPGGPAWQGGVTKGAILERIDGVSVREMELDMIIGRLRGAPGTVVQVEMAGEEGRFNLVRAPLPISQEEYDRLVQSAELQRRRAGGTQSAFTQFVQQNQPDPNWATKYQEKVKAQNAGVENTIQRVNDRQVVQKSLNQDAGLIQNATNKFEHQKALDLYKADAEKLKDIPPP